MWSTTERSRISWPGLFPRIHSAVFAFLIMGSFTPISAQQLDTLPKKSTQQLDTLPKKKAKPAADTDTSKAQRDAKRIIRQARPVRLWEAGLAFGGVMLASTLDQTINREVRRHTSPTLDDIATVFRQQGEPWYYIGMSVGVFGTGVILNSPDVRRAGRRLVASVLVAGTATYALKALVGRSRPNERVGAFAFHPFTSLKDSAGVETRGSFPSGHSMTAFAVATSLAEDIRNPIASVVLYTAAVGAAWSRIYDNRHWFSDTFLGAMLGVTTAKVVSGRWRVFGWRPPAFMVRPTGEASIQWTVPVNLAHAAYSNH